jgi:beta-phosphoglucomutase-like phosphatase (HAD superfamily)
MSSGASQRPIASYWRQNAWGRKSRIVVFEDAPAGIQAAEATGAALVVVTAAHSGSLDTSHPTITGYGKLTAALLHG